MKWLGLKIKTLAKERNIPLTKLAIQSGVSRQTVNDWIKGQIPKGNHLITLCKIFQVQPDDFFSVDMERSITLPVHRARKTAKINRDMQSDAIQLATEYELLFKNEAESSVVPVIRVGQKNNENAKKIAKDLRLKSGIGEDSPIDNEHMFILMDNLRIYIIFRKFPEAIKAYAFYTKIHEHRVVFVNNSTNIIDLIFPMLHESVHAIRDETDSADDYDKEEEDFCDSVANYIQFPERYVEMIYSVIHRQPIGSQINLLKSFSRTHKHSLHGIVKRIKLNHPDFDLNVGGADTNLKKKFPTIGDILFESDDPRYYIEKISTFINNFIKTMYNQMNNMSYRKLGELLGLESSLDAKVVKEELSKYKKSIAV